MSNKPLSYEALRTVIEYMEPNLRQISGRIPAVHTVEKLLPLKFDTLEFGRIQTRVNRTTYRLGVYRQYHNIEEVSKNHETKNANGGIEHDLNEHGFETVTFTGDVSSGDVEILYPSSGGFRWLQNRVFDYSQHLLEKHIEIYEKAVTMKLEQSEDLSIARGEGKAIVAGRFFTETADPIVNQRNERYLLENILSLTVEELREKIQYFHATLIPYRCRRDNTSLPFTPFIQLTVESPAGVLVYRHSYVKLHRAMKKLNTVLFGGRKCVHRSRSLNIMEPLIVIRMPEGVRLEIQELRVSGHVASNYEALKLIVEETSYPLNSLTIYDGFLEEDLYGHSIVKSAKTLSIKPNLRHLRPCLPFLRLLKNETIRVDCVRWFFPVEDQINLVENWLNEDKEIGPSLFYDDNRLHVVTEVLAEIYIRFDGIRHIENLVVMPMNNGNRLEVSYAPIDVDEQRIFRVGMKVVAAENFF